MSSRPLVRVPIRDKVVQRLRQVALDVIQVKLKMGAVSNLGDFKRLHCVPDGDVNFVMSSDPFKRYSELRAAPS